MPTKIHHLVSLSVLLASTPVEAFHSNNVVRSLTTPVSLEREVWNCDNQKGHSFQHQNAFTSSSSRHVPSITSYRYSSKTRTTPTTSATQLSSFSSRSFFRTAETTTTTVDTTTRTPSSPSQSISSLGRLLIAASLQATSTAKQQIKSLSQSLGELQYPVALEALVQQVSHFILQYWWSFPLFLALVPVITTYVLGTGDAFMPHWWPCTKMDHIVGAPDAFMVIGCFLLSNIAYFASGAFLVAKFPLVRPESSQTTTFHDRKSRSGSSGSVLRIIHSNLKEWRMVPTRQTWLGLLLLASGLISTIFHTEQALGSYAIANSLCYIDHAIAGTATFYYFDTCNAPSKRVWALGLAGLACLSIPHSAYAWLHSLWHFLSAGAATLWALESFDNNGWGDHHHKKNQSTDPTGKRMVEQIRLPPQLD